VDRKDHAPTEARRYTNEALVRMLPIYIILFGFISLVIIGIWYDKIIPPIYKAISKLFSFVPKKAEIKSNTKGKSTGKLNQSPKKDPIEDVMMHLAGLSTSNTNTINNLIWFVVSLFLFYQLGLFQNSAYNIWIIIIVIFIHEAGHYVAMRAFGYLDVKIFFIPFLGAATSGIHTNQSGSKKVIVSLAGPMPGIIIGIILGVIYFRTSNDMLLQPARMFLLINTFNLLPLFPLDGGRVFESLFSWRYQWLEIIFKIISGLLLISLSILMGYLLLIFLSFGFLCSVFITVIPLSIIIKKVHLQKPTDQSMCSEHIPYDYIQIIYDLIRKKLVFDQPPRAMASNIQYVWQRLCNRTPNALTTCGIIGVYIILFVFSAGSLLIFEAMLRNPV
jgi:Zn-dependent protease